MDSTIVAAVIGAVIGSTASLVGTWLQSYLGNGQLKEHSLLEARRSAYSRLLFVVKSEDIYPSDFIPSMYRDVREEIEEYNLKMEKWRNNRKQVKAVASEALLLTENFKLKAKLQEFVSSKDPQLCLFDIEHLMRKELGIKDINTG